MLSPVDRASRFTLLALLGGRTAGEMGEAEAKVIALYEGQQGYANWSLRLLAGKMVGLGITDSISHETVRRTLKNGFSCKRKVQYWVIPPESGVRSAASA